MRNIAKILLGITLLALLLVPASSTIAQDKGDALTRTLVADAEQLAIIQEIWGQPISVAEYFETVYPGELRRMLEALPEQSQELLFEIQWYWPDVPPPPAAPRDSADPWSGQAIQGGASDSVVQVATYSVPPYSPMANTVAHGFWMVTAPPTTMPTLSCASYLYYWNGSGQELVGSYSRWGAFVSTLEGTNYVYSTEEGLYSNATSSAFISPPGYTPIAGQYGGNSGWWWVSP